MFTRHSILSIANQSNLQCFPGSGEVTITRTHDKCHISLRGACDHVLDEVPVTWGINDIMPLVTTSCSSYTVTINNLHPVLVVEVISSRSIFTQIFNHDDVGVGYQNFISPVVQPSQLLQPPKQPATARTSDEGTC